LPAAVDTSVREWHPVLGTPLVEWIAQTIQGAAGGSRIPGYSAVRAVWPARRSIEAQPPPALLADGRSASTAWQVLAPGLFALRLHWSELQSVGAEAASSAAPLLPPTIAGPVIAELMHVLWDSPFPALMQDKRGRIVEVNAAFESFSGYPRERLIGIDASQLEPEADRQSRLDGFERQPALGKERALTNRRLQSADGRERWYREARSELTDEHGRVFTMAVLQDTTAEHVAREAGPDDLDLGQLGHAAVSPCAWSAGCRAARSRLRARRPSRGSTTRSSRRRTRRRTAPRTYSR
jgi:PAS domain S-box-containing protein